VAPAYALDLIPGAAERSDECDLAQDQYRDADRRFETAHACLHYGPAHANNLDRVQRRVRVVARASRPRARGPPAANLACVSCARLIQVIAALQLL
jgi:hypothetical protein